MYLQPGGNLDLQPGSKLDLQPSGNFDLQSGSNLDLQPSGNLDFQPGSNVKNMTKEEEEEDQGHSSLRRSRPQYCVKINESSY